MAASGAVTSSKRVAAVKGKAKAEPKVAAAKPKPRKIIKATKAVVSRATAKSKLTAKVRRNDTQDSAAEDAAAAGESKAITEASTACSNPVDATPADAKLAAQKNAAAKPAAKPKALVQRVYNTIDLELSKLEQQKGVSSQDRERASRALSQMVNSLEKAIDMQREMIKSAAPRSSVKDTEALRHAEDLRREIAERLERLNGGRKPRRRAGAAQ